MDPPLTKQATAIWNAWSQMGNREVAREAAAKGTHVDLAIKFLSSRNEISKIDAETWFKNEVLMWVKELLTRKQIHRSKHIMSNAGINPIDQFYDIFIKADSEHYRKYIGEHLITNNNLDDHTKNLWKMFDLIQIHHNKISHVSQCKCIKDLIDRGPDWQSKVATTLFLITFEDCLPSFIKPLDLFKYLIATNNNLVRIWIAVSYNEHYIVPEEVDKNLLAFFKDHTISEEMLDLLNQDHIGLNDTLKDEIYGELCRVGVFQKEEKNDFLKILNRFLHFELSSIYRVLAQENSTVTTDKFVEMLSEYCERNNILTVLSACSNFLPIFSYEGSVSHHIDFLVKCKKLKWYSVESLKDHIISTVNYVKDCDYKEYFEKNPLILCAIILFTDDMHLMEFPKNKIISGGIEVSKYFRSLVDKFSILRMLCEDTRQNYESKSFYTLIEDHLNVKVEKLFEYRCGNNEVPHFNSSFMVEKFGYKKSLDYSFYISEFRPSIAAKLIVLYQLQNFDNDESNLLLKQNDKVFKLATNNFENIELICSCICFKEMIGLPSDKLRVQLNVAQMFFDTGFDSMQCKDMLKQSESTPHEIQELLERKILEDIDFEFATADDFIKAKSKYELVMKFSRENSVKLPEGFLRNCAMKNDWLSFTIYAQIQNYPIEQIKEVLQCFKNPFYLEHMLHCVTYDIRLEDQNVLMGHRDSRSAFLSRVGVRQGAGSLNSSDSRSMRSLSNYTLSDSFDILDVDILSTKATLLQTLIRCHNSADPPRALLQACQLYRNPLLSVLATSYEPDSVHTNWLTWLVVSCDLCQSYTNLEGLVMMANTTREILEMGMKKGYPQTILKSFKIFFPDNCLRHFLEFLCCGISHIYDTKMLSHQLELFETTLRGCRKASIMQQPDHDILYMKNRCWIEETALILMAYALEYNFKSAYEQILFLRVICELKVGELFSVETPNFANVLGIATTLFETKSKTLLNLSKIFNTALYRESIVECLNSLISEKLFSAALKIAELGNLPKDLVVLMEWQDRFDNRRNDKHFWTKCDESFQSHSVMADRVVEFYTSVLLKSNNQFEKFELSKLAYKWARRYDLSTQFELEKDMILNYINLEEKNRDLSLLEVQRETMLYKDILDAMEQIPICPIPVPKETDVQVRHLMSLALDKCNFFMAMRLEKMFSIIDSDVDILKLCFSLAEGLKMPYQLDAKERIFLNKVSNFRRYSSNRKTLLSSRLSSISSLSKSTSLQVPNSSIDAMVVDTPGDDTLTIIQILSEKLTKGSEIATNLLMTYRVSVNIQIPYHVIVCDTDGMSLLKSALELDCSKKLEVVHDFILIYQWNVNTISDFICEEVVNNLNHHVKSKTEYPTMWDLNLNKEFHHILRLLPEDCSLLGHKIFSYARAIFKAQVTSNEDVKVSELYYIIELVIRAHDCFTTDCNMEGISSVLNKCQIIIMHLVSLRSWKLIVRLLTAIARYSEMNYVFQILRENEQFEFLLMKGSREDNALRTALLQYLRKYCPDNRDLYKMVALHFALFSEVAVLWERDASNIIKNLISISKLEMQNNKINPDTEPYVILTNTDGTRLCLSKAMENYTYATEFHLQGEKLTKAMESAKQAELLAVQLSLFSGLSVSGSAICILGLENSQILNLISSQLSFEQALILVEAYNYSTDWATVLFNQCILQKKMIYLEHFLNHLPLTEAITRDTCRKFLSNYDAVDRDGILNMKVILNKLPSVHAKYQIASELGFSDIVEDLITTGQLCYLKDTVWKRGYKNSGSNS